MAKKAKKAAATTIGSREELEQVMGEYAAAVIERDRLTAELDERVRLQREVYEGLITPCDAAARGLLEDMEAWAALHPEEFGGERKSIETLHGVLGWRTTPPSVRQLKGVKAEHTLELAKDLAPQYVRTSEALDKEAVLRDRATGALADEDLRALGLRVSQEERFYAEPKREAAS